MPRLVWTPAALDDVTRLHDFLRPHSENVARRAAGVIRSAVAQLGAHPRLGRPVPGMLPEFRECIIPFGRSSYLALYHFDGTQVVILAIRHAREAGY